MRPKIENAPGLTWNARKEGWEARWQARTDLVSRGYEPKSARIWSGSDEELQDPIVIRFIQDRCASLQNEMLVWGRGGIQQIATYDGTLKSLADCYQTDPVSKFSKLRYKTREHYVALLKKILAEHGDERLEDIKARHVHEWHQFWAADGKIAMAHAVVGMLRTIINFGMAFLECEECKRLSMALHTMRFTMPKPRNSTLNADQATLIRATARNAGSFSMALAQAIQFECMLRQKDVIGEWVPIAEPGVSDVTDAGMKWIMGIRWEEIDDNLILRHVTSKRGKPVEVDLKLAPMVMEELALIGERPKRGPVIVAETTGLPYAANTFRKRWRLLAEQAGIPKSVRNMDSRAGAITEATDAGADLEHIRHAATHSDIAMTQRYSRDGAGKTVNVMKQRVEHRNKKGS